MIHEFSEECAPVGDLLQRDVGQPSGMIQAPPAEPDNPTSG
jgi:hypothetical protein